MFKEQGALLLLSFGLALALDICEYQMNGVHLSHPADCNKFVECQNGKTDRIISYPTGLHFNRFIGKCDQRQRAVCDIAFVNFVSEERNCSQCCELYGCYANPPGTPATSETPTKQAAANTTATTHEMFVTPGIHNTSLPPFNPVITDTPFPETPFSPDTAETPLYDRRCSNILTVCIGKSSGSIFPINGTCNQYIVCAEGCANIMPCPDNLQYNSNTERCEFPQNVNCPWQSTPPITGPSGVTCAKHGQCAGKKDGEMLASLQGNGFIVCQCECEREILCPDGTKFNVHLSTCALENGIGNASGNENGNYNGSSNGNGGECEDGNGNGSGSGNGNGSSSSSGNSTENGSGSGNNNSTSNVCGNDIQVCKNRLNGALVPLDGACNKFYQCVHGCSVEMSCPNNLLFNPSKQLCDYPQNYKCPWPHNPPSGPSAGPSGITCPSGGRCAGRANGERLSSVTSCSKFVVCQCDCEVEMSCPKTLYWDYKLLTCNYPEKVNCELANK